MTVPERCTLERDGFTALWYPGRISPEKAIIAVGGVSCDERTSVLMSRFIREQINDFALLLFWAIDDDMRRNGFSELGIGNECLFLGDRCHLYNVCERMGIKIEWLFPTVFMSIHKDKIEIKINHKFTTIWKAE